MSRGHLNLSFDAFLDADAGVWVATSAEGRITTEAPSRDALIERLKVIVPDVLESRLGHAPQGVSITINWARHSANGVLKDAGLPRAF